MYKKLKIKNRLNLELRQSGKLVMRECLNGWLAESINRWIEQGELGHLLLEFWILLDLKYLN